MKHFQKLFEHELQEIYYMEKQMEQSLPEIAKAVRNPKLREVLMQHHREVKEQLIRLEKIGKEFPFSLGHEGSHSLKGFVQDWKELARQGFEGDVLDAAVISYMQKIEHHEIAIYGVLKAIARHLEKKNIFDLLMESSKEEGRADKHLTEIAEQIMTEAQHLKRHIA